MPVRCCVQQNGQYLVYEAVLRRLSTSDKFWVWEFRGAADSPLRYPVVQGIRRTIRIEDLKSLPQTDGVKVLAMQIMLMGGG